MKASGVELKKTRIEFLTLTRNEMKSDLDFLNSLEATAIAPAPATAPADENDESALPTLPLDHPLYATLSPLLDKLSLAQNAPEGLDDEAIEQLLRTLDDTDSAAAGLEDRLDQLLGSLDGMLSALEPVGGKKEAEEAKGEKVVGKQGE